jgi:hypothetical protein
LEEQLLVIVAHTFSVCRFLDTRVSVIMRTHSVTVVTIKLYERLRYLCRHLEKGSTTPTAMSTVGLGIKNHCAGEDQQQYTRLADCSRGTVVGQKNMVNKFRGDQNQE